MWREDWLLIFDNADDPSLVQEYFPRHGNGSLLLTTRAHAVVAIAAPLEVEQMALMEGTRLLLHRTQRQDASATNAYLWQYLVWHLCQAERWKDLQTTLTDLGFLARKALYQGTSSLEADLLQASQIPSRRLFPTEKFFEVPLKSVFDRQKEERPG